MTHNPGALPVLCALSASLLTGCAGAQTPERGTAPPESVQAVQALCDDLAEALAAGNGASAEALFVPDSGFAELARHMHEEPPPAEAVTQLREERARRFQQVARALNEAPGAEFLPPDPSSWTWTDRAPWLIRGVALPVRMEGAERRIVLDQAVQVDGRWYLFQGPVLR